MTIEALEAPAGRLAANRPRRYIHYNMKTIAITIDEETLARVDRLGRGRDRSKLIRLAVREYVTHLELQAQHEREGEVVRTHRQRLNRQARALVREQSRP